MIRRKITTNSLTIKMFPFLAWTLGLFFIGFSLLPLYFFGTTTLHCERLSGAGQCSVSFHNPLLFIDETVMSFDTSLVQGTIVKYANHNQYKVIIKTSIGAIPLTDLSSSNYEAETKIATQIQAFAQDSSIITITEQIADYLAPLLLFLLFSGFGFWVLLSTKITTLTCDKMTQKIFLANQGILGKQKLEFNLSDLISAEEKIISARKSAYLEVILVLTSHEKIATPTTTICVMRLQNHTDAKSVVDAINGFIKPSCILL